MLNRTEYILSNSPIQQDLLKLFTKSQELTILDIGGCEGEESIRYKRIFPLSKIFIFEPLPSNQNIISENIKKYQLSTVELIKAAASDESGVSDFHVSSGQPENKSNLLDWDFGNKSSSLLLPDEHLRLVPWVKFNEVISVKTITLFDFMNEKNISEIDFIHMDVQGAELKVLKGAASQLKKIKAIWLEVADIELYKGQPTRKEIELFMKENGFYLIKSEEEGHYGDQMYLNKNYFKTISIFNGRVIFYFKK